VDNSPCERKGAAILLLGSFVVVTGESSSSVRSMIPLFSGVLNRMLGHACEECVRAWMMPMFWGANALDEITSRHNVNVDRAVRFGGVDVVILDGDGCCIENRDGL